ncbi:MAG: hypothetical protein H6817_07520 [Phycisphaerales bacterium]|nr:hypothetical protein [Phycisphaerales bacterium]
MKRFTAAYLTIMLAMLVAAFVLSRRAMSGELIAMYALVICLLPTVTAWGTTRLILLFRPMREFDAAKHYSIYLPILGICAAVFTIMLISAQAAFLKNWLPDWLYVLSAAVAATALVVLVGCNRRRPGCCLRCGYDITHSLATGRCPECGWCFA